LFLTLQTQRLLERKHKQVVLLLSTHVCRPDANAQKVDASAFTTGLTIFVNDGAATFADTLIGGAGNDTFVVDSGNALVSDDVITGNGGTDVISLLNDANITLGTGLNATGNGTGEATAVTLGAGITGIEQLVVSDLATDNAAGDVTVSFVAAYAQTSMTVDASALDAGETLLVDASANGATEALTILGGADADSVLLGGGSDNVSLAGGNDIISMAIASLSSADTIDGGAGTDTLTFTGAASNITDNIFTNVSALDTVVLTAAAAGASLNYVFGAQAQEAGITTITGGADASGSGDVTIDASAMTSGLTINVSAGSHDYTIAGGSGNDTITLSNGNGSNDDFVQGAPAATPLRLARARTRIPRYVLTWAVMSPRERPWPTPTR